MLVTEFYDAVLVPALNKTASFAPEMVRNRSLKVLMTAISGQEANWTERVQVPGGFARGLFQMQLNDIADIMANDATSGIFDLGMKAFGIKTQTAEHLFNLIETPEGDVLAAFLARLNLYADPKPIPPADIQQAMWEYYLATWRPGMENWKRWEGVYGQALSAVPA